MDTVQAMVGQVAGPLGTAALVLLLATFTLLKREDLRSRLLRLIGQGRISTTTKALDEAGTRVRRYLLMLLVIITGFGLALMFVLLAIGVPFAPLCGFFAAVFRYIPYLGPWLAALLPIALSLLISREWSRALIVVGLAALYMFPRVGAHNAVRRRPD